MSELYFLRHGRRIDHDLAAGASALPIHSPYEVYDPSLSQSALPQIESAARDIAETTAAFDPMLPQGTRKNIFIHFSPYLRCCQTADMLMSHLKEMLAHKYPNYKLRFLLLGDFALSEWIHKDMKDKPPFIDSNDAYRMYTPNVKLMKNRSATSNFRPTNTLGPYNGPDISYKQYLSNCKEYFQKLVATYNMPANIRNRDMVVIVSHGYFINNLMSNFISQPIFKEIPECKINFAHKVPPVEELAHAETGDDEVVDDNGVPYTSYVWELVKDALDIVAENPNSNTVLNFETDIVYYKTNFIKKDELSQPELLNTWTPSEWNYPRRSFDIEPAAKDTMFLEQPKTIAGLSINSKVRHLNGNPICDAAKDWYPDNQLKEFILKSDFKLKDMDITAFKEHFKITNRPLKPISPEVSPNAEPTRNNSIIDLSKLVSNEEIYKPVKLKYSNTGEISISKLNSKVNSQVNLAQAARSGGSAGSSSNSSVVDFSKFFGAAQLGQPVTVEGSAPLGRVRSISNPLVHVVHDAKDSYFPLGVKIVDLAESSSLNMIQEQHGYTPQNEQRPEMVMGSYKKSHVTVNNSLLAKYQQISTDKSADLHVERPKVFSLSFNKEDHQYSDVRKNGTSSPASASVSGSSADVSGAGKQSLGSFKFVPSAALGNASTNNKFATTPSKEKAYFYNFESDDSLDSEEESETVKAKSSSANDNLSSGSEIHFAVKPAKKTDYVWFGQNRN